MRTRVVSRSPSPRRKAPPKSSSEKAKEQADAAEDAMLIKELPGRYRYQLESLVYDDRVQSFLWKPRTLTVLAILAVFLAYMGLYGSESSDSVDNLRSGLLMGCVVLLTQAVLQFDDGPFIRPHPAIWRFVLGCSVLYEMFLVFLLFQNREDGRAMLHRLDSGIGTKPPETNYADDCRLYAPDHASGNPFHPVMEKLDRFIIAHFFGWIIKALMIRDWFILMVCSLAFEFIEYTFEFQLPNFGECWWDHWILDFVLCNFGGAYIGMKICRYLEMREYRWRSIRNISSLTGLAKRTVAQFTPYSWTRFRWLSRRDFPHHAAMVFCICVLLGAEVNAFYLKAALHIPADHIFNPMRLVLCSMAGAVTVAEVYAYVQDANMIKFGQQSAVTGLVLITEMLLSSKYLSGEIAPLSEMDRGWATFWIITLSSTAAFVGVSAVRYILKNMRPSTQNGTEATKLKAR